MSLQGKDCEECSQKGHKTGFCDMMKYFKAHLRGYKPQTNQVTTYVNAVSDRKFVSPIVNGAALNLQFDTASDMTIISKANWTLLGQPTLSNTSRTNATSASGTAIPFLGAFHFSVKLNG